LASHTSKETKESCFKNWLKRKGGFKSIAAFFAGGLCVLLAFELAEAISRLPLRDEAAPVGWFDYWLHRYQTLVSGMLAIVGAAFALWAAYLSIQYDRRKVANEQSEKRRGSILAVERLVAFTSNAALSRHLFVSLMQQADERWTGSNFFLRKWH